MCNELNENENKQTQMGFSHTLLCAFASIGENVELWKKNDSKQLCKWEMNTHFLNFHYKNEF